MSCSSWNSATNLREFGFVLEHFCGIISLYPEFLSFICTSLELVLTLKVLGLLHAPYETRVAFNVVIILKLKDFLCSFQLCLTPDPYSHTSYSSSDDLKADYDSFLISECVLNFGYLPLHPLLL